ncbi:MAG: rod-binding protein [Tepidisphaeraceae bacterium]
MASTPKLDPVKREKELRAYAEKLVAQTFFGAMLKQARQSPWKSEMFGGGRGGEAYQSLMDQQMVQKLGHGVGKKLVDSLVKKWMHTPAQNVPAQPGEVRKELRKSIQPKTYGATAITA